MNQLTKVFEGNQIRIVGTEAEPFFMVKDVCEALGLSNPSKVAGRIRDKYKTNFSLGLSGGAPVFVSEAGLYQIIMRADQNEITERFQDWAYEEVLPSIRKDGGYIAATTEDTPEEILARAVLVAQKTLERVEQEKQAALNQLKDQAPKVLFANAVETSETSILVGQLAKIITQNGVKVGQNRLFHWLREHGYLGKTGAHRNEPTQYSVERGWFEVTERTVQNPDGSVRITRTTKVTGKGQVYFINKFLKEEK